MEAIEPAVLGIPRNGNRDKGLLALAGLVP